MLDTAAREAADLQFDQPSRQSHSDQPVPLGGVPRALREAAEMSGLDPVAELYNEALRYAAEGHLRLARERLVVLLCMKPDDGESRLMLAKIHVAGQRWQDAIAALDEAAACGQPVPLQLRRAVEDHLAAEAAAEQEERSALMAREQGEIKALRQEARRLRSENAQLIGRSTDLERETRRWAWTTAGVAVVAALFIVTNLVVSSGQQAPAEAIAAAPAATSNEATAVVEDGAPITVAATDDSDPATAAERETPKTLATRAARALAAAPGLADTQLEVEVSGTSAVVTGTVIQARQRTTARTVLDGVSGIDTVDVDKVKITARTKGATHEVKKGDTLGKIAGLYYGESTLSSKIYKANRNVMKNPRSLQIGQILKVPAVE
jgi:nucleoid-associated protein YgaU